MSPATNTDDLTKVQKLLEAILASDRLTEEARQSLAQRLLNGELNDELLESLRTFCKEEQAALESDLKLVDDAIAEDQALIDNDEASSLDEQNALADDAEKEMREAQANFKIEASTIERETEQEVEKGERGAESQDIDALRSMLKQPTATDEPKL